MLYSIRKGDKMINVVFICYGNICRSPMAEMIFKDLIYKNNKRYKMYCSSRGTSFEETGNDIYPEAKEVLKKHNINIESHQAKRFEKTDYNKFTHIIVMEEKNQKELLQIIGSDPENKIYRLIEKDIEDPWYTGQFEKVFNEINEGCIKLFNYLKNEIPDNE